MQQMIHTVDLSSDSPSKDTHITVGMFRPLRSALPTMLTSLDHRCPGCCRKFSFSSDNHYAVAVETCYQAGHFDEPVYRKVT